MWQIRIEDPSGETRTVSLKKHLKTGAAISFNIGRDPASDVILRDPLTRAEAAVLHAQPGRSGWEFWIRSVSTQTSMQMGDLPIRDGLFPEGTVLKLGESKLHLERETDGLNLPQQPSQIRAWMTCAESGRKMLWTAKKVAATPLSLYLAGETGTGKEVIAHLLHAWSDRASGPFVPLHCGALSLSLAESELFGHVKGAFTGASHQRSGALMQAHNGTLFLDEIGDLPMDIQIKLLRFLENGEIRPVGADHTTRADVRLICATHHPLQKLVEEGKFRRDLYYRIASVTIELPTLRSRPEDIEMLSRKFAQDLGKSITPQAMLRLQAHGWPGNVRELRHSIERASGMAGPFTSVLTEESFQFLLTEEAVSRSPELELGGAILNLDEMERHLILKALKLSHGNRGTAAQILGIARSTLFEKLKRHRIMGPRAEAALHRQKNTLLFARHSRAHSTTRSVNQISSIRAPEYSRASH